MGSNLNLSPIGYFHSPQKNPHEAGRQPDAHHSPGWIQLLPGQNFEQALIGLEGFSHIWILFQFHHNTEWKPMVMPPRGTDTKQGVFATRSPYRPNPIGMSVARLASIENLKIHVLDADLLDGSPIFDIKPYLAYVDSHPEASAGWLKDQKPLPISFSEKSLAQLHWLEEQGLSQLRGFLHHQLEFEPTDSQRKRVKHLKADYYVLAYRTWRAEFSFTSQQIEIQNIFSGYSEEDLKSSEDPYSDKDLHRLFQEKFRQ